MKRLFLFLLLIFVIYSAKPYWEKPVSNYVDLSFLEPVDHTIHNVTTSEPFEATIQYVSNTIDRVIHFFLADESSDKKTPVEVEKPELVAPEGSQISIYNIEVGTPEE